MPEHVQVNMLGPCDVRARLRLSHWGTPAIEGVGPGAAWPPQRTERPQRRRGPVSAVPGWGTC